MQTGEMNTESLDPGLVLLAFAPVFLLTIGAEARYWARPPTACATPYPTRHWR
jgi:hypothetical protein